jgi:transaldolase
MEIYLDTAKVEEIREFAWLIDGVTTNPTLVAQAGKPFRETLKEICSIVRGPVSAEVVAQDTEGMVREAQELASPFGREMRGGLCLAFRGPHR